MYGSFSYHTDSLMLHLFPNIPNIWYFSCIMYKPCLHKPNIDGLCWLVLTTHKWWQSTVRMVLFHTYTITIDIDYILSQTYRTYMVLFLSVQISSSYWQATTDSLCWCHDSLLMTYRPGHGTMVYLMTKYRACSTFSYHIDIDYILSQTYRTHNTFLVLWTNLVDLLELIMYTNYHTYSSRTFSYHTNSLMLHLFPNIPNLNVRYFSWIMYKLRLFTSHNWRSLLTLEYTS